MIKATGPEQALEIHLRVDFTNSENVDSVMEKVHKSLERYQIISSYSGIVGLNRKVSVEDLTDEELTEAITHNGNRLGSHIGYIKSEIAVALANRHRVRAYLSPDGRVSASVKREEDL